MRNPGLNRYGIITGGKSTRQYPDYREPQKHK